MKKCSRCGKEKHKNDFYRRGGRNRTGLQSYCKKCFNALCNQRWTDRKRKAIELMGGCCSVCGYKRNYAALHFHHLHDKEANWNEARQWGWDRLIQELKKCILVCGNCHSEIHWPECTIEPGQDTDNLTLNERVLISTGECHADGCNNEVFGTRYCSQQCASLSRRIVRRPDKKELTTLIAENSMCAIGRMYGVSDNAVRKWIKSYGI